MGRRARIGEEQLEALVRYLADELGQTRITAALRCAR